MKRKITLFFIGLLNKLGLVLKKDYDYLMKCHSNLRASESMLAYSLSQRNQLCTEQLVKLKNIQADVDNMVDIQNLLADEVSRLMLELDIADKRVEVLTNTLIEKKKLDKKRK